MYRLLPDVRVLDCSSWISGPFCCCLLAGLGAEVLKVEDPEHGDPSRAAGPYPNDEPDREKSGLFLYLNRNKRSVTSNLGSHTGRQLIQSLVRNTDVLVHDLQPPQVSDIGLGYQTLSEMNPRLVVVAITPFGLTGSHSNYRAYHLNKYHASGLGYVTPSGSAWQLHKDREPLVVGGYLGDYQVGLSAAVGAIAGLLARDVTGQGQLVDVSSQEALANLDRTNLSRYANEGILYNRANLHTAFVGGVLCCRNGYVQLVVAEDHQWDSLVRLMECPSWAACGEYETRAGRASHMAEINPRIAQWAKQYDKEELYHLCQAAGVPAGPVLTPSEVIVSEQVRARGFFQKTVHPKAGELSYPGALFQVRGVERTPDYSAPLLGEHNNDVDLPQLGLAPLPATASDKLDIISKEPVVFSTETNELTPLEGVRILDLTWAAMGPYSTLLLAMLGAEVIKVESARRLGGREELMRHTFVNLNFGKLSITLDLTHPRARALVKRLASISDVVIENLRPGALDKLGLGFEELRAAKHDIVVISGSTMGATGPEAGYRGYAAAFGALAGISHITGYPDGLPVEMRLPMDMTAGTGMALATLVALRFARRSGDGLHVDLGAREVLSSLIGHVFLDWFMNARDASRQGNENPLMAPHGVYRCKGDDAWISIAVGSDREWEALCGVIGRPELVEDDRFCDSHERWLHRQEADDIVAQWTGRYDPYELAERLQAAEVAAFPSYSNKDLYQDIHLRDRGAWLSVSDAALGKCTVLGLPWKLAGLAPREDLVVAEAGEHNHYVCCELLGLPLSELEELKALGVVGR